MTAGDVQTRDAMPAEGRRLRVCVLWCGGSSYITAGVRELQKDPRLQVSMRVQLDGRGYDASILRGIDDAISVPHERERAVEEHVAMVLDARPDVLIVSGWMMPAYVRLAGHPAMRDTRFIMSIDNPWHGSLRQRLAGLVKRSYIRRMSTVVAACERSRLYARKIGVPAARVRIGCYCCDYDAFSPALEQRLALGEWPRRFLYVGRLAEVKGIEEMLEGHRQYRTLVENPWPLSVCGKGPLEPSLRDRPGVENLGFFQPSDLPRIFSRHGAFLLASRHEPWGVVIAEACAAGLPVACSDECGAGMDLVRDYSNGVVFASRDPAGVRDALLFLHRAHPRLPEMGAMSRSMAIPYSAQHWARRWAEYATEAASRPVPG